MSHLDEYDAENVARFDDLDDPRSDAAGVVYGCACALLVVIGLIGLGMLAASACWWLAW